VAKYFAGEEASADGRCSCKARTPEDARRVYETVVKSGERASKFQRQMQKEWYALAKPIWRPRPWTCIGRGGQFGQIVRGHSHQLVSHAAAGRRMDFFMNQMRAGG